MYAVSDEYKIAMKRPVQRFRMKGTFANLPFTEENILSGSFVITNQCSDGNEVKIGQVYIGELSATFRKLEFPRYSLDGKPIKPIFQRMVASGTYEDVPLGVFNISEAEHTAAGIEIKAYDNMAKLDKNCTINSATGTPYRLALMACANCGVELGTSEEEFVKFANGTETLSMLSENDIETWRDFISWVAQACACFVTCDRKGNIVFRAYGQDVVDTIDPQHRFSGGSFSDFETRYTGMSVVNIGDKTTSYYGLETDDALTYNLGSNPFLQYGVSEALTDIRLAILRALQKIDYVPFKVQMIGDPCYDLGDVFKFPDGIADSDKLFCMTKYTFRYNGSYEMVGVGKNPALANAKSKTDKNIAGLMNTDDEDKLHFVVFTNTSAVDVVDGDDKSVMFMRFIVRETTHVVIDMEFLVTAETTESGDFLNWIENDAVVTVTYYIDGEEVELRHPVETWQDGKHVFRLRYDLQAAKAAIHTWDVWFSMNGGSVHIEPYDIHTVVMGQGLTGDGEWNGVIDARDDMQRFTMYMFRDMEEQMKVSGEVPKKAKPSDTVGRFDFLNMFRGITDTYTATNNLMTFTPWVNQDKVSTTCNTDKTLGWVGAGTTALDTALSVTTVSMTGVERVETRSSNAIFDVSFDGGKTWVGWTTVGWVKGAYMIKDEIEAVTPTGWASGGSSVIIRVTLETDASLFTLDVYGGKVNA